MTTLAYLRVSKDTQDTKNQRLAILESLLLDSGVL
jgi:DNA invertase Pin-like site-specific DNA recombinase